MQQTRNLGRVSPCLRHGLMLLALLATGTWAMAQPDADTAALWLFDEPQYMNMTLTDASDGMTDLRLLPGGRLKAGNFGNALSLKAESGAATELAKGPNRYDIGLVSSINARVPATRPVKEPARVLSALSGAEWTVECWLKLGHAPVNAVTLFEAGHGTTPVFSCVLGAGGEAFQLTLADGSLVKLPVPGGSLSDGGWHHVAFTRGATGTVQLWVDGHKGAEAAKNEVAAGPDQRPGLVQVIYADGERKRPVDVQVRGTMDDYFGIKTLYSPINFVHTWHGRVVGPADGDVEFQIESDNPVNLKVDGKQVIDATSATLARGRVAMRKGQTYLFEVNVRELGGNTAVRLDWQLPGEAWTMIPEGVFFHTRADLEQAQQELTTFAGELAKWSSIPDWEWERLSWPRPKGSPPVTADIAGIARGIGQRPYIMIGGETARAGALDGAVDELRISTKARYSQDFDVPASFARNSANPAPATTPDGPPLLFAGDPDDRPVPLGSRKHLFIDDKMIDARGYLQLKPQPPTAMEPTDLTNSKPWEHPTAGAFGDTNFYDHDGEIRLTYLNNSVWEEPDTTHTVCVATSRDGLHFTKPELGIHSWNGSKANNIIFTIPLQGRIFKDNRTGIPADELFKCSGYVVDRGIFLFTSPDGFHWKRNETMMLPFDSGGGVEMFWDDQRGLYNCFLRHEGWVFMRQPFGRAAALSQTREPFKPWPFTPIARPVPRWESWSLPSVCEELPTPFVPYPINSTKDPNFRIGQVYRTRAVKYAWAPDTYVGFDYRLFGSPVQSEESRKTGLSISRDGEHWTSMHSPFYYDNQWTYEGTKVVECLAVDGLTRRGDELWQYIMVKFKSHALWSDQDRIFRTRQRLDGFVALETTGREGWMRTRSFTFDGKQLELNLNSKGVTKVALLDEQSRELPGFGLQDCDAIKADSVRQVVTWKGNSDVSKFVGRPVRVLFKMNDAKLYALQFTGK